MTATKKKEPIEASWEEAALPYLSVWAYSIPKSSIHFGDLEQNHFPVT